MGKGNRNRQYRVQEQMDAPQNVKPKKKHRKPFRAPKWLMPAVAAVLVLAIAFGIVYAVINSTGTFERNRILVKSQSGEYDINQQMATYIAWQNAYYSSYYYYMYCQMGLYQDTNNITKNYAADEYALLASQSTMLEFPRDCIDDIAASLRQYVAVCDDAVSKNVTLDAEDMAAIDQEVEGLMNIKTTYEKYATEANQGITVSYSSLEDFLKDLTGINMKEEDVRDASKLITLYNKHYTQVTADFEAAVTLADRETYRNENLTSFFTLDYLTYTTTDETFSTKLKGAKDENEFKVLVVESIFNGKYKTPAGMTDDTTFKEDLLNSIYNELSLTNPIDGKEFEITGKYETASEKMEALKDALKAEGADITTLLTEAGGKDLTDVEASKAKAEAAVAAEGDNETDGEQTDKVEVPTAVQKLVKDAEVSVGTILSDANYLVYITAVMDKKVNLTYVKLEDDMLLTMKDEMINGTKKSDGTSNKDGLNDTLPTVQTQSYSESTKEGSFSAWLCEKGEGLAFTRKQNDTHVITEEKKDNADGKTKPHYSVYFVTEAMHCDTDKVVNGGYYKISSATRDADAENIKAQLTGLTGKALTDKLTELSNSAATVSNAITEKTATTANSDLSKWLFDEARKDGDITVIKGDKDTYVVVYVSNMEAWQRTATDKITDQRAAAWQTGLAANYTVDEKVLKKIGKPTATTEATTAA